MSKYDTYSEFPRGYTDYDRVDGPVYIIEGSESDEEWIRSSVSVPVEQ